MRNAMTNPDIKERQDSCKHDGIQTWRIGDGSPAGMWSCAQCGAKFVPLAQCDAEVAAERERWRAVAEYAAHQLEKARIWGGMEWHYNPLPPLHYRSALERLRDVLKA